MENNISNAVYESLKADATELSKLNEQYSNIESNIKSGRFSAATIRNELEPKRIELYSKKESLSESAIRKAHAMVEQYRQDAAKLNDLDSSQLNDADLKLLQLGDLLNVRDLTAMVERNKSNRTMVQLIMRYADKHEISLPVDYIGGQAEEETANALDMIIDTYQKWINTADAFTTLDQFFNRA